MDPASAILTFVNTGVQVIKLVKDTLDDIRNAPKELQALRDRVDGVEALLGQLQCRRMDGVFEGDEHRDLAVLEQLGRSANVCIEEISLFSRKVQKIGKDGRQVVYKLKWAMKGGKLTELSSQLDRLDMTLNAVMNLVNS